MDKLKILLSAILLAISTIAIAEHDTESTAQQEDLQKVRKEISDADRDVKNKRAEQKKIAERIRATEKELVRQRAELDSILNEKKVAVDELEALQQRASQLETQIAGMKTQVARLVNSQYHNNQPDALVLMLQNSNPNDKGRHLQYARYIQNANRKLINQLKAQQNELERQSVAINEQIEKVQELINRQRAIVEKLTKQKKMQLSEADKLDDDISRNEKKIRGLRGNEARLSSLLKQLETQKAQQQRTQNDIKENSNKSNNTAENDAAIPDKVAYNNSGASDTPVIDSAFSRMRGKLTLPVKGSIEGRFGSPKPNGGSYNGLYIATPPQPVQAVAAGKVAYAGDLQGYGKTVIVDHDNAYLTVYTGLSSISVGNGREVKSRQTIGTTGTLPDETRGLYFEIRYHTRPLDPSGWFVKS
ncbi:MAG: peptidoglycan DD-metalloendopeptidase family protein [Neisseriaceae bacterium]|nr:peptidoglycan DD-metalloendopeptidase family protein [Neisseriaceae bacterium]